MGRSFPAITWQNPFPRRPTTSLFWHLLPFLEDRKVLADSCSILTGMSLGIFTSLTSLNPFLTRLTTLVWPQIPSPWRLPPSDPCHQHSTSLTFVKIGKIFLVFSSQITSSFPDESQSLSWPFEMFCINGDPGFWISRQSPAFLHGFLIIYLILQCSETISPLLSNHSLLPISAPLWGESTWKSQEFLRNSLLSTAPWRRCQHCEGCVFLDSMTVPNSCK